MGGTGARSIPSTARAPVSTRAQGGGHRPGAGRRLILALASLLWLAWMAFLITLALRT